MRRPVSLLILLSSRVAAASDVSLDAEEAVRLAVAQAPAVQVARAQVQVSATEPDVAGMWPNPQITVGSNLNSARGYANVSFPLPILGQRGAGIAVGEATVELAKRSEGVTRSDTALATRMAWTDLWQAEQEVAVLATTQERRQTLLNMTQQRYQAGSAAQLEVLRARTEWVRAQADVGAAQAQVRGRAAALAAWVYAQPCACTLHTRGAPPVQVPPNENEDDADLGAHPMVQQALAAVQVGEAQLHWEKALRWPTFAIELGGAGWSPTAPSNDGHAALVLELPVFNLRGALIERATAQVQRLEADRQALTTQVRTDVATTQSALQAATVHARAQVDDILPAAQQAANLALEGYSSGAFDINSVLLAEQSLADARLDTYRALAEQSRAWAAHVHARGVMP